ncbi:MAG: VOC family protein [Paracoccaceae bacterium]
MKAQLDHLAVSATTLAEGVAYLEDLFTTKLAPGGDHPQMGTHNRLISLGDTYLEVIAINPDAPPPSHPRWFDLDNFTGPPRLTNWIIRTPDMAKTLANTPEGTGEILNLERGDFRWQMAVPKTGKLPFDNAFPALIHWFGTAHPADRLPKSGLTLASLKIQHPQADALKSSLEPLLDISYIHFASKPEFNLSATINTPTGQVTLK